MSEPRHVLICRECEWESEPAESLVTVMKEMGEAILPRCPECGAADFRGVTR